MRRDDIVVSHTHTPCCLRVLYPYQLQINTEIFVNIIICSLRFALNGPIEKGEMGQDVAVWRLGNRTKDYINYVLISVN